MKQLIRNPNIDAFDYTLSFHKFKICIYEEDEDKAMKTLKHEFLDYVISRTMELYERIVNKFIQMLNEEVYRRKEKLTEALVELT